MTRRYGKSGIMKAWSEHVLNSGGVVVSLKDGAIETRRRHGPFDVITTEPPRIFGTKAEIIIVDEVSE